MDNSRFWISEKLWHQPKYAIRAGRLQYLGFLGWYPDKEHEKLYKLLDNKFKISEMNAGEYMEIEFEVDFDTNIMK
jgi:hypothetical protein